MEQLVFPPPPLTIGQEYTAPNGVTYAWDGETWVAAGGTVAPLWTDNATSGLMGTSNAGRSLSLSPDAAVHFGDPTQDPCPCVESDGDNLTLEMPGSGTCSVTIGGETVATFEDKGLTLQGSLVVSGPVTVGPAFQAPDAPRGTVALDPDDHFRGCTGGGAWLQLDGVVGPASGDLAGSSYPAPVIAPGAVTAAKIAPGVIPTIPTTLPPSGSVPAGDLAGSSYPSPVIAPGAVTAAKIAPGVIPTIPTTLPPSGPVPAGDLAGSSYPAPVIAPGAVTAAKIAPGVIPTVPTTLPPSGAVPSGDLAGSSYPSPVIAPGAVTAAKIAAGVIPTTLPPSGAAGGDLAGSTFPAPVIKAGAVTAAKIAAGVIPTTLPPSGAAGGDLAGSTFPAPVVAPGAVTFPKLAPGAAAGAVVQESPAGLSVAISTAEVTLYTNTITTTHGGGILLVACPELTLVMGQVYTITLRLKVDGVTLMTLAPGAIDATKSGNIYTPTLMWFAAAQAPGAHTVTVTGQRATATGTVTFTDISFMALELA